MVGRNTKYINSEKIEEESFLFFGKSKIKLKTE